LKELCEPEVSQLVGLVFDEYIRRFQISVDYGMLMQVAIAADELFNDDQSFGLGHFFAFL
jgi:hypothetical protein